MWDQTKAAFIPGGPPPAGFELLPSKWEDESNATKHLGFPVANNFSTLQLKEQIQFGVSSNLNKLKQRHLSLAGRVLIANSLIMSTIWYFITLWAGDLDFLNHLQSQIERFIWAGRSQVARGTATQPKSFGGLGLLLIVEQFHSIAGNIMIWVSGGSLIHFLAFCVHTSRSFPAGTGDILISLG